MTIENKLRRKLIVTLATCAVQMLCADTCYSKDVVIFENGVYKADIVLPTSPNGVERFAAEELKYHFRKAFGKEPEVIGENLLKTKGHSFHVYIGATKAAIEAELPVGKLNDEECVVKTSGDGLYLLGGDADTTYDEVMELGSVAMRGTLYAVYDFLENEMGVKWLWPGEIGVVVPKRTELKIGEINRSGQEPLESRGFIIRRNKEKIGFLKDENAQKFFQEQNKFLVRQRHGKRRAFKAGHSFGNWWQKYHKDHPEYFNLLPNGKRIPQRSPRLCTICVSEPGVRLQRVKEWREWWTKASKLRHPFLPWVNCCENDAAALCVCERCRSWDGPDPRFEKSPYWNGSLAKDFDEKYMGRKFHVEMGLSNGSRWGSYPTLPTAEFAASLSDRYVRFYNEVAAEAKKYNPEAKAIGYAYANYIEPPMKTRVGRDTIIIFVPRSYFPYDKEESTEFRKQWIGWCQMGATRMVYRPNYMLAGGSYPIDTSRLILSDFAFAATNGMFAVCQDSLTGAWSSQAMHLYALTRALRDPLRGYEKARADMLSGFGSAAELIDQYFNLVECHSAKWTNESFREVGFKNATRGYMGGSFACPNAILGDFFDEKFFADSYAIFDEALRQSADDTDVKDRIEYLRKGVKDTELGRICRIAQKASEAAPEDEAKRQAYAEAFKALLAYRASVEGELVCNYNFHAKKEMFFGWKHKLHEENKKVDKVKGKPAGWNEGE